MENSFQTHEHCSCGVLWSLGTDVIRGVPDFLFSFYKWMHIFSEMKLHIGIVWKHFNRMHRVTLTNQVHILNDNEIFLRPCLSCVNTGSQCKTVRVHFHHVRRLRVRWPHGAVRRLWNFFLFELSAELQRRHELHVGNHSGAWQGGWTSPLGRSVRTDSRSCWGQREVWLLIEVDCGEQRRTSPLFCAVTQSRCIIKW